MLLAASVQPSFGALFVALPSEYFYTRVTSGAHAFVSEVSAVFLQPHACLPRLASYRNGQTISTDALEASTAPSKQTRGDCYGMYGERS